MQSISDLRMHAVIWGCSAWDVRGPLFCFSRGPLSVPYSVTNTYLCEASLCAPYQFVCHLFLASITQVGIYLSITV